MRTYAILFSMTLALQGCLYAISPEMADKADKNVPFETLLTDPDSYQGKLLILGGTITRTIEVNRGTLIELDQKPLDYWGKPQRTSRTGGRFLVFHPGRLNELVYVPGTAVTIAGEVLGTGSAVIAESKYGDPLLVVKELKHWAPESRSRDQLQWMDPLYDPARSGRPE